MIRSLATRGVGRRADHAYVVTTDPSVPHSTVTSCGHSPAVSLAFAGGLAGLWSLRPELVTSEGIRERMQRLVIGTSAMAILAWATVLTGTWVVYPWYRENLAGDDPAACAQGPGPNCSPRDYLLSGQGGDTEDWHEFGMEWKEHIAWIAPMLATVAAFLVIYCGADLARRPRVRWMTMASE
jgi:hypothetical protein